MPDWQPAAVLVRPDVKEILPTLGRAASFPTGHRDCAKSLQLILKCRRRGFTAAPIQRARSAQDQRFQMSLLGVRGRGENPGGALRSRNAVPPPVVARHRKDARRKADPWRKMKLGNCSAIVGTLS